MLTVYRYYNRKAKRVRTESRTSHLSSRKLLDPVEQQLPVCNSQIDSLITDVLVCSDQRDRFSVKPGKSICVKHSNCTRRFKRYR